MKLSIRNKQRGQALVMVTLSLVAMCGMLGLAVDLGWSYFVRRNAQQFADAGALAAAQQVLAGTGGNSITSCPTAGCPSNFSCASTVASSPGNYLNDACLYIRGNALSSNSWYGFVDGTNSGRTQTAKLDAGLGNPPITPSIQAQYWIRARVSENIPQLFSAVLGNALATVGGRATAALVKLPWNVSVWGLDRQNDTNPTPAIGGLGGPPSGSDLWVGGNGSITVPSAVSLASAANGTTPAGVYSGATQGNGSVTDSATLVNSGGATTGSGFTPAPTSAPDSPQFLDPMKGKVSPPAPPAGLTPCPINVATGIPTGSVLGPGIYYAVSGGVPVPQQVPINGAVTFAAGGSCLSGVKQGSSGFGNYVIFGGLANGGNTYTVEPGRYVLAGVPQTRGAANPILQLTSNGSIKDLSTAGVQNTDAGEVFILTDYNYPGLPVPPALASNPSVLKQFQQGYIDVQGGNSAKGTVTLHGLNTNNSTVQSDNLDIYGPLLFWQDRRNSTVDYDNPLVSPQKDDGNIVCGNYSNTACPNVPDPTLNGVDVAYQSPVFQLQGAPNQKLYGLIYQPRGSMIYIQGGGKVDSPIQIITGSIYLQGNASITSTGLQNSLTHLVAALVE